MLPSHSNAKTKWVKSNDTINVPNFINKLFGFDKSVDFSMNREIQELLTMQKNNVVQSGCGDCGEVMTETHDNNNDIQIMENKMKHVINKHQLQNIYDVHSSQFNSHDVNEMPNIHSFVNEGFEGGEEDDEEEGFEGGEEDDEEEGFEGGEDDEEEGFEGGEEDDEEEGFEGGEEGFVEGLKKMKKPKPIKIAKPKPVKIAKPKPIKIAKPKKLKPLKVAKPKKIKPIKTKKSTKKHKSPPPPPKKTTAEKVKDGILNTLDKINEMILLVTTFLFVQFDKIILEKLCKPYVEKINNLNKKMKLFNGGNNGGEDTSKDANIIKQFIYLFLSFPLAVFVMFNWYYLLVTRNELSKSPELKEKLTEVEYAINFSNATLKSTMDFLFAYSLEPTKIFNKFMLNFEQTPKFMNTMFSSHNIKRFLLLFFSIFIVYFVNFFDMIEMIFSSKPMSFVHIAMTSFVSIVIAILFFVQLYDKITGNSDLKTASNPDINKLNMNSINGVNYVLDTAASKLKMLAVPFYVMFFVVFILFVIKFIIAVFSIKIATVLLVLYLWVHSLFGIKLYENEKGDWAKEFMAFITLGMSPKYQSTVDEKCEQEVVDMSDPCDETIFQKIMKLLMFSLKDNGYTLVLMLVMFIAMASLLPFLSSYSVKMTTTFVLLLVVFFIFLNVMSNVFKRAGKVFED